MIDRRVFLSALSGGLLAAPLAADAQQAGKVYRVGYMGVVSRQSAEPLVLIFQRGGISSSNGAGPTGRWSGFLASRRSWPSSTWTSSLRHSRTLIPIVHVVAGDPLADGLVTISG